MFAALKTRLGRAIFGTTTFVLLFWEVPWVKRIIAALTGIDFIYEKSDWWGKAAHMAINPPPGTALLVGIVGLVLIYWSTKPREVRMSAPIIGMLICFIGLAGFGIWYLVSNQPAAEPAQAASPTAVATAPGPADSSGPSMLSGRPVSGLEVATRLERLEKEHAATVAELAATKQQLDSKKQELADVSQPKTPATRLGQIQADPPKPQPKRYTAYEREQRLRAVDEIYGVIATKLTPAFQQGRSLFTTDRALNLIIANGTYEKELTDYRNSVEGGFKELNGVLGKYEYFSDIIATAKKNNFNGLAATNASGNLIGEIQFLQKIAPGNVEQMLLRDVVLMEVRNANRDFESYLNDTIPALKRMRAEIEGAEIYSGQ